MNSTKAAAGRVELTMPAAWRTLAVWCYTWATRLTTSGGRNEVLKLLVKSSVRRVPKRIFLPMQLNISHLHAPTLGGKDTYWNYWRIICTLVISTHGMALTQIKSAMWLLLWRPWLPWPTARPVLARAAGCRPWTPPPLPPAWPASRRWRTRTRSATSY